jgi:hypothetical protein
MVVAKWFGFGAFLVSSVAAAQDAPPESVTSTPSFLLADRQDSVSRIGLDAEYLLLSNAPDITLTRFDAHAQFVNPATRFGSYVNVPIALATGSMMQDTLVLGNIEAGGLYVLEMSPNVGLALHAGLTLPTAPAMDDGDWLFGAAAGSMRPSDMYQVLPKSSSMRMGISPLIRDGQFFARLDLGFDANLYLPGADDNAHPAIHADAAVGFDLGTLNASVMGEVSTLYIFSEQDTSNNTEMSSNPSVAAVSVRGHSGSVQPYGGFVLPLEKSMRDVLDGALVVGLDGTL